MNKCFEFSARCPEQQNNNISDRWDYPPLTNKIGKWGISNFLLQKNGAFRKKRHVTSFKTRNEPIMKLFQFGAFQNKMHMTSHEKCIFHML